MFFFSIFFFRVFVFCCLSLFTRLCFMPSFTYYHFCELCYAIHYNRTPCFFIFFLFFFLLGFCFSAVFHCLLGFVSCRLSLSIISSYRLMFHAVFHFLLFSLRVLFSSVFHFQIVYHTDFCLMPFFTCELLCELHFITAFYH